MTIEIRTLEEGELITEPGFYDIPLEVHHSHPTDGPAVTSSTLRDMELRSPGYVWAFHPRNEHRFIKPDSDAKRMGRAMAYVVEGGVDLLLEHFTVLEEDAPPRPTAAQVKAWERTGEWSESAKPRAEFWEKQDQDPRQILTPGEWGKTVLMGNALRVDRAIAAVMGGIPEITMAWKDPETGIWCLSRPDTINEDGTVTDYKRMSTQGRPFDHRLVDRRITQFAYDMQLAFGAEGMEALDLGWPSMAGIIAQCEEPPYHAILREIGEYDLRLGQFRNRYALRRFRECWDLMHEKGWPHYRAWPGPGEDVAVYQRPEAETKWLEERRNMQTAGDGAAVSTPTEDPRRSTEDRPDPDALKALYREFPGLDLHP